MGSRYESFVKNRYWILRHGKSIPNEKGLIVSSLVRYFILHLSDARSYDNSSLIL